MTKKEMAIKSLYGICNEQLTLTTELCRNIIETISKCYQPNLPTEKPSVEAEFMITELTSFIRGIKKAERDNQNVESALK